MRGSSVPVGCCMLLSPPWSLLNSDWQATAGTLLAALHVCHCAGDQHLHACLTVCMPCQSGIFSTITVLHACEARQCHFNHASAPIYTT